MSYISLDDLNPITAAYANRIKDTVSVGGGSIVFNQTLEAALEGTDVTVDMFERVRDARNHLTAAVKLVAGEAAVATFVDNKDVVQLSGTCPVAGDAISVTFNRSAQVPAGMPEKGKPVERKTQWGHNRARFDAVGSKCIDDANARILSGALKALGQ